MSEVLQDNTAQPSSLNIAEILARATGRSLDVAVSLGGEATIVHVQEMPAHEYVRLYQLAEAPLPGTVKMVFDSHRFKTLRIIGSLTGESAIPGKSLDEKMSAMMPHPRTGENVPAIDALSSIPAGMHQALDELAEEVNSDSMDARGRVDTMLEGVGALWEIVKYCTDHKLTLADLAEKDVFMSEIALYSAFAAQVSRAQAEQLREQLVNTGVTTPVG